MATENDIVLIYFEDQPLVFARIESILPDSKRDWYHVKLLMLHVPPQLVTWILRDVYINGTEFTMNGKRLRLEKVVSTEEQPLRGPEVTRKEDTAEAKSSGGSKVISLTDLKKK